MRDYFYLGFGMALLFLLPVSLVENAAYSVFVFFRGERRNNTRTLLLGTFVVSLISTSVAFALILDSLADTDLLALAVTLCWSWYFVLVPQAIIRKILSPGDTRTQRGSQLGKVLLRISLTLVLPGALYLVHGILGSLLGVPSD